MVSRHTCADKEHYRTPRAHNAPVTITPCSLPHTPSKAGKFHPSFAREFVLRRFALSPRRTLGLLAAMAIGLFGAFLLTSPASAHTAAVKGTAACESATGTWTVTWTVSNDYNLVATLSDVKAGPDGSTLTGLASTIPAAAKGGHTTITGTETVKAPATVATLSAHVVWSDNYTQDVKGSVELTGPCTESPSPSASPSAPASPSASPSKTAVAPVSSSPASGTGAGSTLPVTGTSLTWFIVAAVVLIGGGAALFFVSRRRRTNA
jgi:LPXTG-motif cell wall-anchored protein